MAPASAISELVRNAAGQFRTRIDKCLAQRDEDLAPREVKSALDECLAALSQCRIWGEGNRLASSELWNIAGDLLETGWLQSRARLKPRGYAGDDELLARIARIEICEHPLGRHFDHYFQSQAAAQAVRNRIAMAGGWIEDAASARPELCRIVSVGSGPALDVALACQRLAVEVRRGLRVTLLDIDGQALASAAARLAPLLLPKQLELVQGNLFRLHERPALAAHLQEADLLLCIGLFDYLGDDVATSMLGEFWRRIAPGGAARIFNFAPHNPTRAYMEWIGNWYLTYRTGEDLARLAQAAGVPQECRQLGAEPLGVDLYLEMVRPEGVKNCG